MMMRVALSLILLSVLSFLVFTRLKMKYQECLKDNTKFPGRKHNNSTKITNLELVIFYVKMLALLVTTTAQKRTQFVI